LRLLHSFFRAKHQVLALLQYDPFLTPTPAAAASSTSTLNQPEHADNKKSPDDRQDGPAW
jgi:hypothetical protein